MTKYEKIPGPVLDVYESLLLSAERIKAGTWVVCTVGKDGTLTPDEKARAEILDNLGGSAWVTREIIADNTDTLEP
jgi:hypothetical protein